jgi:hypothetical protein
MVIINFYIEVIYTLPVLDDVHADPEGLQNYLGRIISLLAILYCHHGFGVENLLLLKLILLPYSAFNYFITVKYFLYHSLGYKFFFLLYYP